ncbi:hypothetical protein MLD38_014080 [Melastoma candidum]|uniref:Uncharacterized protein n=1 Tax=Melastoma candidum TaxID=119954 RepID=A0ACB9RBK5_9MYRT|nr:hypothetical protein MLD38_014080 [Melastoma candidum]
MFSMLKVALEPIPKNSDSLEPTMRPDSPRDVLLNHLVMDTSQSPIFSTMLDPSDWDTPATSNYQFCFIEANETRGVAKQAEIFAHRFDDRVQVT